ncbi:MAG: sodium/proton-translocating pyrophosphatase, partial [Thermodesulfobacteriota bacterium]|nr:sodium/proton-translocating pyrophosphatase [Thermodesulfobacteriota bacterium]
MVSLIYVYAALFLALVFTFVFNRRTMMESTGNKKMQDIAAFIQKGSAQFLKTEFIYLGLFVIIVA